MAAIGLKLNVLHHKYIFRTPGDCLTLLLSLLRRFVVNGLEIKLHFSGLGSRASGINTLVVL